MLFHPFGYWFISSKGKDRDRATVSRSFHKETTLGQMALFSWRSNDKRDGRFRRSGRIHQFIQKLLALQ